MSHCAQQIRDWFRSTLDAVSALPDAVEGRPRQVAAGLTACIVTTTLDTIVESDIHSNTDQHALTVLVILIAGSLDAADAMSVLAEHGIANATPTTGVTIDQLQREYDESVETDRDYMSVTLTYTATYSATRSNVEAFA